MNNFLRITLIILKSIFYVVSFIVLKNHHITLSLTNVSKIYIRYIPRKLITILLRFQYFTKLEVNIL